MTFNEAKLRTRLGIKVKLPHWTTVKCVVTFHDDGQVSYVLGDESIRTALIPLAWCNRSDWEIYHEIQTSNDPI